MMTRTKGHRLFLLATVATVAMTCGAQAATKKKKPKPEDANAQAVTLDTINVQGGKNGAVGYQAKRTSTATKTNTPLRDVPQSVTVVTRQQIDDTGAQKIEDVVRYVPGVSWHQGEGNRDQVVIRGQSSTADFFVNGMRDDAQIYRDLYNAQSIEVLKGPNAMIFGRGGGGGVVNRVLKEADGTPVREVTVQGGSFNNKRASFDVGGAVNPDFAARINGVFEDTDNYRDFFHLQRGGINPTFTWTPTKSTRVTLSYEYFRDKRTGDRGIPSQNGVPYNTSPSTFFGNPALSYSPATQNILISTVEHEFDSGLKVKSQTRFADYKRFYQNVFAGSAVNPATNTLTLAAYNNTNDRQNIDNQTDWTFKARTGAMAHTILFGTEFANQKSANARFAGAFAGSAVVNADNPVSYVPVSFATGLATDARNRTNLNIAAIYAQDQVEVTRWLQVIGGLRYDQFRLGYVNLNPLAPATFGQTFDRTDNLLSPRVGVVVKPVEPLSLYANYSVSYLPASGDQFNALTATTVTLKPEQFTNKEVGAKWDITPRLNATAALFQLDRENTQLRDNTGVVVAEGSSRVNGVELGLAGYVTERWQVTAGYTHLFARLLTATTAAGSAPGNRLPFTPSDMFSVWNRYDFNDQWAAGVGVVSQTAYYANIDNLVTIPGYTRVDGAIYYKLNKNLRGQLNVENIFGAKYYPSADSNNNITPGSPRAFRISLTGSL